MNKFIIWINQEKVTFVYIILTDFNFMRKIVTFVYIILTDFNFTRKIKVEK